MCVVVYFDSTIYFDHRRCEQPEARFFSFRFILLSHFSFLVFALALILFLFFFDFFFVFFCLLLSFPQVKKRIEVQIRKI